MDTLQIGNRTFQAKGKTYVMGILNTTPDSFSDGGHYQALDAALYHAQQMIKEGACILDIGGESTRPGYTRISEEEEIERVVPIIEAVSKRFDIPISVDTYKSKVAKVAIQAGACLVNDIWGLKEDPDMAQLVKDMQVCVCFMHNRKNADYENFFEDLLNDLNESVRICKEYNIPKEKLILDPGVGFAKSYEQNLEVIQRLDELNVFGLPVLLGTSRKSVIGLTLSLPADKRLIGTVATTVCAVMKGCQFVRVHDVEANIQAITMTEAILYSSKTKD